MSHAATNWAHNRRGLKPAAKIILLTLADCHNPAYGCFPTQAYIADACEMSRDTVNVQLSRLECAGLIRRIRSIDPQTKRQRPTRYKLAFESDFDPSEGETLSKMKSGKAVSEKPTQDEKAVSEIQAKPCRENHASRVGISYTNLVKEPVSKTCVAETDAAQTSIEFENFWKAHPRPRNRERAEKLFAAALASGVHAIQILEAVKRYRAENAGNKMQYVAFSDNWLDQRRWEDYQNRTPVVARTDAVKDVAIFWAGKVKAGGYVPHTAISEEVMACMISNGLVQEQDLLRAGIRI